MGGKLSRHSSEQKTIEELSQRIINLKQLILHMQDTEFHPRCAEIRADIATIALDIQTLQTVTKHQEVMDTCDEFLHDVNTCSQLLTKIEEDVRKSSIDEVVGSDLKKLEKDVGDMENSINELLRSHDLKVLEELERTTHILYRKVEEMNTKPRTQLNERKEKVGRKLLKHNKKVRDAIAQLRAIIHTGANTWSHSPRSASNQEFIDQILSDEFNLAYSRRIQNRKSVEFSSLRTNFLSSQLGANKRSYGGSMDIPSCLKRDPIKRFSQSYGENMVAEEPKPVRIRSSEIKKYCLSKDNISTEV